MYVMCGTMPMSIESTMSGRTLATPTTPTQPSVRLAGEDDEVSLSPMSGVSPSVTSLEEESPPATTSRPPPPVRKNALMAALQITNLSYAHYYKSLAEVWGVDPMF